MEGLEGTETWIKHYSSKHQMLLVGEGDFSFALCLAKAFGSASNITATSLDTRAELLRQYSGAKANIEELEELGCTIIHQVDVHTMSQHSLLYGKQFDRIVFNFPHAGFDVFFKERSSELIKEHQEVVRGFLRSARKMVKGDNIGEIHVTHKTAFPFDKWKVEALAQSEGLSLLDKVPFFMWDFPGYVNKRGAGSRCDNSFPVGQCSTFKFGKP